MKLRRIVSITLILIMSLYIILSTFEGIGNIVNAGQYVSISEAERMCPGISGMVNSLKNAHSNYNFQFYNTGIDWNEAIIREYQGHGASPKNLFNVGEAYSGMWFCPVCGTKSYDNGSLRCASMEALKYMMDPRNSISDDSVFQFKSLESPDVTYDDVVRVIAGTFLDHEECARAIVEASQAYNINGYYLVAKMLTEHGKNGSTLSNGVVKNGVTYYNFFNIGAYGNGTSAIITNGTNYAAEAGWSTKRLSILGGAKIVRDSYVGRGQNTCYYQKYNVVHEGSLFSHQYAQNILSAENEGRKLRKNYTINGQITGTHTFIIPLYTNMPANPQSRPSTATVNSITYDIAKVTANGNLNVRSRQDKNSTAIGSIAQGVNVKVLSRGNVQSGGYYWDLVIADGTGLTGYVARNYIQTIGQGSNSGASTPNEYKDTTSVNSIKITGNSIVPLGTTTKLTANVSPSNATNKNVTWSSSDTNVATVDSSGNVTAKTMGKTTITATAQDGTGIKGVYNVQTTDLSFTDVAPNAWYYNAAKYCSQNNIIKGTSKTTFAPETKLSRGMVVTILYRMEGEQAVNGAPKFPDVQDSNQYYYKAVKWATDNKIVNGYSNGNFGPEDNVLRQDLAIMLYNYAKLKGKDIAKTNDLNDFKDKDNVADYALNQVKWAVGSGVITGNSDKTLNPAGTATRAEAGAMFEKYCKRVGR